MRLDVAHQLSVLQQYVHSVVPHDAVAELYHDGVGLVLVERGQDAFRGGHEAVVGVRGGGQARVAERHARQSAPWSSMLSRSRWVATPASLAAAIR